MKEQEFEMFEMYETRKNVNDTLTFYKCPVGSPVPVDCLSFDRQGNKYFVLGQWKRYEDAQFRAEQVLMR